MGRYEDLLLLSKEINIDELRRRSKMEYYFMLGHVEFIRREYSKAYNHFMRCEKYLSNNRYYFDLSLLYEDLYSITGKMEYKDESMKYKQLGGIYNILLKD